MNFFIMVSLFLSAALGVFRGIDLALLTDAETGLCIVGPVWLRYGALARALYLPGTSDGRTLCAGGLAAFALCLCWELPTVLQTLVQEGGGALLTPTLLFRLGLCCVGALGALSAVRCTRTEQDA